MKSLRTLVSLLVLVVFAASIGWTAEATKPTTKTVKGYTTKTGKVVKGYERKVPSKTEAKSTEAKAKTPETSTVKGYTTKTGKVVKPYERKVPSKTTPEVKTAPKTKAKTTPAEAGKGPGGEKTVYVKGYTTKTGKVVKGYWRRPPTKKSP